MIECPACRISFSPRLRRCPRCNAYEARLEDRLEYLVQAAETELDQGAKTTEIEEMLIHEGLAPLDAVEIVSAQAKKVSRVERSYGLVRLLGGAVLLVLAVTAIGLGIWGSSGRLVLLGAAVGAIGVWPFVLGVYSTVTGRERW
jgi:predicted ATP-dependent serine protease